MDTKRGTTTKDAIAERLAGTQERTRFLLREVTEEDLGRQHDQTMSPLI